MRTEKRGQNPGTSAGGVCLPVLCPPALHEAHPDGAHPGELVNSLEALVDRLGQQRSKLLVVENLQITAWNTKRGGGQTRAAALLGGGRKTLLCSDLGGSCRRWLGASRTAGCSWDSGQRWRCRSGTRRKPPRRCSTTSPRDLGGQQSWSCWLLWEGGGRRWLKQAYLCASWSSQPWRSC